MRRWRLALVSGPAFAAAGGVAVMLFVGLLAGQDYNYDLENYHFASATLLLRGTLDRNVAPSGVQSWFNPIGYVPLTLAIRTLPPFLVSALLAIVAGLNAPLIYLVADKVGEGLPRPVRSRAALACVLIGMTGAITLAEAATSFLDDVLSIAELGALLAAMNALSRSRRDQLPWLGLSGLLLGSASGLKLTVAVFAIALTGALIVLLVRRRIGWGAAMTFAAGGAAGFLVTGGWWTWHLWETYGNPLFPMANDIFHSSWLPARALNDTSFQPRHWTDAVAEPWHWLIGDRTPGAEIMIRDGRYAVGLLASVVVVFLAFVRSRRHGETRLLAALFFVFAYIAWLLPFGILRYAVVLEMLSGVVLLAMLRSLPGLSQRACLAVMIVAALALLAWTRPASWGRVAFTGDWFGVQGIGAIHRPDTLYVMPDDAPLGFVTAFFPADARFVHIGGNLPLDPSFGLGRRAAVMIAQAPLLRTLAAMPNNSKGIAALRRFGLAEVAGSCRPIRTKAALAESCLLARRPVL